MLSFLECTFHAIPKHANSLLFSVAKVCHKSSTCRRTNSTDGFPLGASTGSMDMYEGKEAADPSAGKTARRLTRVIPRERQKERRKEERKKRKRMRIAQPPEAAKGNSGCAKEISVCYGVRCRGGASYSLAGVTSAAPAALAATVHTRKEAVL